MAAIEENAFVIIGTLLVNLEVDFYVGFNRKCSEARPIDFSLFALFFFIVLLHLHLHLFLFFLFFLSFFFILMFFSFQSLFFPFLFLSTCTQPFFVAPCFAEISHISLMDSIETASLILLPKLNPFLCKNCLTSASFRSNYSL